MRTSSALFAAGVALLAVACEPKPPTVCSDLPQQRVFVGQTGTVAPCFEDPGGGTLSFTAESSDHSVATANSVADGVVFGGVSPGEAVVTVTATNDNKLSAKAAFLVLVPNRPPTYASHLETARIVLGRGLRLDLRELFTEPDGEKMTFTGTSSASAIAGVSVVANSALVTGLSGGVAQVTLTATDTHGAEATGTIRIFVPVWTTMLEDGFDEQVSLDDWTGLDAKLSVKDGSLHIEPLAEGYFGVASRALDGVTDFEIYLGMKPVTGGQTGVIWRTGDAGIEAYLFVTGELTIGEDRANWAFAWLSSGLWSDPFHGESDLVKLGEYADFNIFLSQDNIRISTGDGVLFSKHILDGTAPALHEIRLVAAEQTGQFDYVALAGFPLDDPGAKTRQVRLPVLDTRTRR